MISIVKIVINLRRLYLLLLVAMGFSFLSSCVTTKPNIPVSDPIPELSYIEQKNPLLATELRKIPELQDGLSAEEIEALGDLADLYQENQTDFEAAFAEMYQVGLPEHRKYCSPLQALFWLFEDGYQDEAERVMRNYSLYGLLNRAWTEDERWDSYSVVSDRLNSPELVDFYINHFLTYRGGRRAHGSYMMFKTKVGHCTDAAYFALDMLKRSGYKTFMRSVRWGSDNWNDVHTGSGIVLEDGSYLLVGNFGWNSYSNTISGPHKSIEELDTMLSRGRKVTQSAWGAFYPP